MSQTKGYKMKNNWRRTVHNAIVKRLEEGKLFIEIDKLKKAKKSLTAILAHRSRRCAAQ
jgi:hypothetical protein